MVLPRASLLLVISMLTASFVVDRLTAARVPTVTHIAPRSGVLSGGTEVRIYGHNLAFITYCRFGTLDGKLTHVSPDGTQVCCQSPKGEVPGPVPLTVSEMWGSDARWLPVAPLNTTLFTYYEPPKILSIQPISGPSTGGKETVIQTDNRWLASKDLDRAMCLFGEVITNVTNFECHDKSCYVTCPTPQMCFAHDPVEQERCKEQDVQVYISMNGQDFTSDPLTRPTYTFTNAWTYPAAAAAA